MKQEQKPLATIAVTPLLMTYLPEQCAPLIEDVTNGMGWDERMMLRGDEIKSGMTFRAFVPCSNGKKIDNKKYRAWNATKVFTAEERAGVIWGTCTEKYSKARVAVHEFVVESTRGYLKHNNI